QGCGARHATLRYGGDESPPRRNRNPDCARRARRPSCRPGRLAFVGPAHRAFQHHADPVSGKVPRAEPAGKRLAVHARKLALKSDLQILRRHRRPLLRGLEQARRSTLADHVHRNARLGLQVLIRESWYYASPNASAAASGLTQRKRHFGQCDYWDTVTAIDPVWKIIKPSRPGRIANGRGVMFA